MSKIIVVLGEGGCVEYIYTDCPNRDFEVILMDFCNQESEQDPESGVFAVDEDDECSPIAQVVYMNPIDVSAMDEEDSVIYNKFLDYNKE